MLAQAVPADADRTAVSFMILWDSSFSDVMGWDARFLRLRKESARVAAVKNRARGGTERRIWCRKAVLQLGLLGWSSAQDKLDMAGCAEPVTGEIDANDEGSVFEVPGCKMGDTNDLFGSSVVSTRAGIQHILDDREGGGSLTATLEQI